MNTERLMLRQSSMQFSDSRAEIREDAVELLVPPAERGAPDIIALSETTPNSTVFSIIERVAERRGYQFAAARTGDCHFLVHPRHKVLEVGYVHVLDGQGGLPKGNYSNRGIAEVTIRTPEGNVITDHSTHWLTAFVLDRNPGKESLREVKFDQQTDAMIERVALHGKGRRISFWQGDTNIHEQADTGFDRDAIHYQFAQRGLVSVYDALKDESRKDDDYPGTHGSREKSRTIDIIGHYEHDGRVTPLKFKVHPPRNSDHNIVDALYDIAPLSRRRG